MEHFSSFCEDTTLHGWQYVDKQTFTKLQKIFWGVILFLSGVGATLFLYDNIVIFKNATVVTTIDTMTAPLNEVFFPSITVCNLNQARMSFFEEIGVYGNDNLITQILSEYLGADNANSGVEIPRDIIKKLDKISPEIHWCYQLKFSYDV